MTILFTLSYVTGLKSARQIILLLQKKEKNHRKRQEANMLLVRKGCGEDIEQEYLFIDKDRNSAVKLTKIFLSEKGDDIYFCFKDDKPYGDPDVPKGLEEFRQGKCKNLLYSGSVWVEIKEISVSHALVRPMIEVEGYMCSEPWDV